MKYIDTHTHIDSEEFNEDLDATIARAKESGAGALFIPGINWSNIETIANVVNKYPGYCYGMIGLHPEDVREDYREVVSQMKVWLQDSLNSQFSILNSYQPIAIGEIGLDFYWSREFEKEQLDAFELQVKLSLEVNLPLMIHCRKAQNELLHILKKYPTLLTGVFHCFTGNEQEAKELLTFPRFYLGIGGVLTFKKSNLPETLRNAVPLNRIVLETDSPYMAPVPHRGERNESSFIPFIINKLAEIYNVSPDQVANITTNNAKKIFNI